MSSDRVARDNGKRGGRPRNVMAARCKGPGDRRSGSKCGACPGYGDRKWPQRVQHPPGAGVLDQHVEWTSRSSPASSTTFLQQASICAPGEGVLGLLAAHRVARSPGRLGPNPLEDDGVVAHVAALTPGIRRSAPGRRPDAVTGQA